MQSMPFGEHVGHDLPSSCLCPVLECARKDVSPASHIPNKQLPKNKWHYLNLSMSADISRTGCQELKISVCHRMSREGTGYLHDNEFLHGGR